MKSPTANLPGGAFQIVCTFFEFNPTLRIQSNRNCSYAFFKGGIEEHGQNAIIKVFVPMSRTFNRIRDIKRCINLIFPHLYKLLRRHGTSRVIKALLRTTPENLAHVLRIAHQPRDADGVWWSKIIHFYFGN